MGFSFNINSEKANAANFIYDYDQCDQIGLLLNDLGNTNRTKVAQIFTNFWATFYEKCHFWRGKLL